MALRKRIFKILPKELLECARCHWALPLSEFYANKRYKSGYKTTCIECNNKVRKMNPKHLKNSSLSAAKFRKKNPRSARSFQLKGLYGITIEDYDQMYAEQRGCCKICGEHHDKLYIDHCHTTDKVRGLLCPCCNAFIGMAKENVEILTNAIQYIKRHSNVGMQNLTTSKTG